MPCRSSACLSLWGSQLGQKLVLVPSSSFFLGPCKLVHKRVLWAGTWHAKMKPASLSPLEYWKGFGYSKQSNRTWAALEYPSVSKCLFGLQTVLLFPKLGLPVSMQTGLGVLRGLQSKPSPFPGWELMSSGVGKVGDHVKDYFAMSSVPPDRQQCLPSVDVRGSAVSVG